jgi:hypothetical protein
MRIRRRARLRESPLAAGFHRGVIQASALRKRYATGLVRRAQVAIFKKVAAIAK